MKEHELIRRFVNDVAEDEFQPKYRRTNFGLPVTNWANRLQTYFWPTPARRHPENDLQLRPLIARGTELALAYPHGWTSRQRRAAERFASDVFDWGRVRRIERGWKDVQAVIGAALGEPVKAPMNSGWTKVAALATNHLEKKNRSHVIWDSRVSHSSLKRIEAILLRNKIREIPPYLQHLGRVPGRGGTRANAQYRLRWPYSYRRWDSQRAASAFVRNVRDELNRQRVRPQEWTVRSVEMVLFMDGY